jgi:hypothetical protein
MAFLRTDLSEVTTKGAVFSECSRADLRGSDVSAIEPDTVELHGAVVDFEQAVQSARALGLEVLPQGVPRR